MKTKSTRTLTSAEFDILSRMLREIQADFSNFASENRAEESAHTSEKVLFELSLLSKFSQNLLINRKISTDNAYIGCFIPTLIGYYIANRCRFSVISLFKAMREAY